MTRPQSRLQYITMSIPELFLTNDIHEWLLRTRLQERCRRALEQALRGLIADGEVKGGAAVALGSMPFSAAPGPAGRPPGSIVTW